MKHILFLTHFFPPEVTAGANRTYEHVKRWQRQGHKITVITNNPNHPNGFLHDNYENKWFHDENYNGINVLRVKTFLTPNKGTFRRTINFLVYMTMAVIASARVKNVDCIVATSPQFFSGFAGTIVKFFKRKPFVLEIRDLWPDSIVAVGAMKDTNIIIKAIRLLEKQMYFSADHIVPLTNAFKAHIKEFSYPEEQITVIPNSVDLDQMKNYKKVACDFEKGEKFICSYIGTFGMAHKVETILFCAEKLKDHDKIHFLLIGDGADRDHLIDLKKKLNLDNVTILPLQPKANIPFFLEMSDVGLIVLRNSELFRTVIPSKIFEYMAMDNSLILSIPDGETTGLLKDGKFGMAVPPQNPEKLAESVLYLYENETIRKEMETTGKKMVLDYYNRDNLATEMISLIESIS